MDLLLICHTTDTCQAHHLTAFLDKGYHIDVVYASPDPISMQTASILAEQRRLPVFKAHALQQLDSALAENPQLNQANGGESLLAAYHRVAEFICVVLDNHDTQNVALVIHPNLVQLLMRHLLGLHLAAPVQFVADAGSCTHLLLNSNSASLMLFNYVPEKISAGGETSFPTHCTSICSQE